MQLLAGQGCPHEQKSSGPKSGQLELMVDMHSVFVMFEKVNPPKTCGPKAQNPVGATGIVVVVVVVAGAVVVVVVAGTVVVVVSSHGVDATEAIGVASEGQEPPGNEQTLSLH